MNDKHRDMIRTCQHFTVSLMEILRTFKPMWMESREVIIKNEKLNICNNNRCLFFVSML